jgi:hypothetical protein
MSPQDQMQSMRETIDHLVVHSRMRDGGAATGLVTIREGDTANLEAVQRLLAGVAANLDAVQLILHRGYVATKPGKWGR